MDVHSASCLSHGDLGGEAHIQTIAVCQVTDNPFCKEKLVCGCVKGAGEELYLVLLVDFAV